MRKTKFLIGAFILLAFCTKAQDTAKYIRFGVVPYQLLSRSMGAYFSLPYKKSSWEYRATYTRATKNLGIPYWTGISHDWFFYQGLNNNIVYHPNIQENKHVRLLLIYRIWWYQNQWIPEDGISTASSYSFKNKQSSLINGPGAGVEFTWDFSDNHFDGNFYFNFSQSVLVGSKSVFESKNGAYFINKTRPIKQTIRRPIFNFTLGLEIGYRKKKE